MPIEFRCACGQKFRVGDEHAGKKTKCKGCGEIVAIPKKAVKKPAAAKPTAGADEGLFVLEPSAESDAGGDNEFDFALEDTRPARRLPGKPGAKKKRRDSEDDAPKSKKKKKRSSSSDGTPKPALIAMLAILGLVGVGGIGFVLIKVFGGGGAKAEPIDKTYAVAKHEVANFSIDYPEDWTATPAGGSGGSPPSIQIEGDGAYFRVKGSLGGAAIGDMAQAGSNVGSNLGLNLPGEGGAEVENAGPEIDLEPVAAVHDLQGKFFEQDYDDYEETPGQKIDTPFGEGRISTYTAKKGMFGGKIKGFRASFLATDYNYNIYCYVPEGQFGQYEPIFRKMIGSFKR